MKGSKNQSESKQLRAGTPRAAAAPSPASSRPRLVAIDLDGTLLDDAKQISSRTINALARAAAGGVKVVIASARPPRSVRPTYRKLGLDTWQINYNGALIWDEPGKKVIFHRPMDGQLVRRIIDQARKIAPQVLVTCEILDRWYTDRFEQPYTTETGRLFKPDVIAPLESFCNQPITKLMLLGEAGMIRRLERVMGLLHGNTVSIVRTDEELIQIMHRKVSKATALKKVADHYGIKTSQIMAIGDAPNDVGMLQLAGIAVAVDNAHPRVKSVAHWVAPSNNDHGVWAALRRYGVA